VNESRYGTPVPRPIQVSRPVNSRSYRHRDDDKDDDDDDDDKDGDAVSEAIPGNIRNSDHFLMFMKRFNEYLKSRLRVQHVVQETPPSFLKDCQTKVFIDRKPLR